MGILCIVAIFLTELLHLPLITFLDNHIYDRIVKLGLRPHQQSPHVVVINIDNNSVQKEGRWPWPRSKMAELISKLKQLGVVTIGLDIVMSESEVNYAQGLKDALQPLSHKLTLQQKQELPKFLNQIADEVDSDQIFSNSLLEHNVVLGYLFHNDTDIRQGVLPDPLTDSQKQILYRHQLPLFQFSGYNGCLELFLHASTQAGTVTNLPDPDGSVRHGLMLASYDNKLYSSLALSVAMNYLMVDHVNLKLEDGRLKGLQIGSVFIPTNRNGQVLIPFWGSAGTLGYYSATDILQGRAKAENLQGAIAIVGSTMVLLADLHHTPVADSFPGVEMVGNMVQGIIGKQLITPFDWRTSQGKISLFFIGCAFAVLFALVGIAWMLILAAISIIALLLITVYLFSVKSLYVPLAFILVLIIVQTLANYGYLFLMERRQKRKINQLFGQYVPQDYVKELIESPEQSSMEGQVRNMTVQFTDIRGFTSISENLEAHEVKRLLNAFFTPLTEIIFSFRGTIDKYVGDMIVAFWGAPMHDEDHAYHAVKSSLTILEHLPEINANMILQNLPAVNIGIGLSTGLMNVGDMGSEFRRAYTVLGDTVNLASRLQDLTKFYQVNILVSDGTQKSLEQFVWRPIDRITVKGRKTGLTIYQPLGLYADASEDLLQEMEEYQQALNDYYACNWSLAEEKFVMLKGKYPSVYVYQMYWERIKEYQAEPPEQSWDGIYVHHHK